MNPWASSSHSLGVDQMETRGTEGWEMDVLKAGPNDSSFCVSARACRPPLYWVGWRCPPLPRMREYMRLSPSPCIQHMCSSCRCGCGSAVVRRDCHHPCRERRVSKEQGNPVGMGRSPYNQKGKKTNQTKQGNTLQSVHRAW